MFNGCGKVLIFAKNNYLRGKTRKNEEVFKKIIR